MASVILESVSKVFHDGTEAVRDLNLEIEDGELVVLVGPSGCGKTTALRMVAGLEEVSAGTIRIGERVVNEIDPRDRDVAMVFQNYALYPHMNVRDNVAFPLRIAGRGRGERDGAVAKVAKTLGLDPYLARKPRQLSGGQRQRVAMGRALVREPQVFLMDEPLSNLDAKLRVQMRAEISSLQRTLGVTTLYVTHDQVEAMTMGDRVAVLRGGELQQFGGPQEVYDAPANVFVAGFIGSPPMNLVEAVVEVSNADIAVNLGEQRVSVDEAEARDHRPLARMDGARVVVGVRPENLEDAALVPRIPKNRIMHGSVLVREALGSDALVHVVVAGSHGISRKVLDLAHDVEDSSELDDLARESKRVFIGRFSPRSPVREDQTIAMAMLPGSLQFFDGETGTTLKEG